MKKSEVRAINQQIAAVTRKSVPVALFCTVAIVVPVAILNSKGFVSESIEPFVMTAGIVGLIAPLYFVFARLNRIKSRIKLVCQSCKNAADRSVFPVINEDCHCPNCGAELFED